MEIHTETVTIIEEQMQDIKSNGAEIRCSISMNGRMTGTPEPVAALRKALIDGGHTSDCIRIEGMTHSSSNESIGCTAIMVLVACGAAFSKGAQLEVFLPVILIGGAAVMAYFWWFNRTTTCSFRIHCKDSAAVERTHQKLGENIKFQVLNTDWRYEVDSAALTGWAEKCIQRAHLRAEKVAEALGVKLDGVHSYEESHSLPRNNYTPDFGGGAPAMARMAVARRATLDSYEPDNGPSDAERGGLGVIVRYRIKKPA